MKHLLLALFFALSAIVQAQPFDLKPNDVIALTGASNIERTRFNGFLQTHLIASKPELKIKVRNFGWEGDTVFEQWRDDGNVEQLETKRQAAERRIQSETGSTSWRQQRDWKQQLNDASATIVIAQFGQMESLQGRSNLPQFITAYERLIEDFAADGRQVILVAPVAFEKASHPLARDLSTLNADLAAYTKAIQELATKRNLLFIAIDQDVADRVPLTDNGFQLTEAGHCFVANQIASALGIPLTTNEPVRQEVIEMERLWFDYWRPMNWAFLTGDRTNVPYSKDWKDSTKRIFPQEMEDFRPLLDQAEQNIQNALAGKPTTPIAVHSSIPVEPPSAAPQSPDEELASFTILDGFKVNLFASEADGIIKPIQMRWDEHGRLWVACAISYPQIKPGEKPNDYVLVCEDTNGDGKADKFHKFVEGLFMPSGIELGDGGLYVAQGTELLHFKDTDGDDKADSRRIVLGGFGTADSHQMINCINWGFGGELWFTQGHHIYSRVETAYGVETLNRAGVWRYRPRTGHLDPFFQWSSAGANCWGVVTTSYGQPFHKSGANIGSYYSTPGLIRSDLALNTQAMNLCLAPIKQVGMEFLNSSHFPEEMQGRIVIGGYYANLLEWHELKYENGLFSTTRLPNIIETKNTVFRPVEVRCGPDGGLYVADWYNPIIGHYQASYRHPDRDKAHGRIWRVTHQDRPLVKPAPLANATIPTLLDHLDSPERWAAYQAKRLLFERDSRDVTTALDTWTSQNNSNDYRRLQALSVFEAHESPRPGLLKSLLRAPDPRIRAYATRTLSTWARNATLPEALTLLETQIADADPLVRLEAIVAASYIPDPRAAIVAARALDQDFNAYHQHALTKTLHATNALWAPLLSAGKLQFDQDAHLIFALQNGWQENNPTHLTKVANASASDQKAQLDSLRNPSSQASTIMRQQAILHAGDPKREIVWLKALAAVASDDDFPLIFQRAATQPEVLAALKSRKPQDAEKWLTPLFDSPNPALRLQAIRLAGLWKLNAFDDRIQTIALDPSAALPLRTAAVASLRNAKPLLQLLNDPAIHTAALDALITIHPAAAAKHILQRLATIKTPAEAVPLLQPLLDRKQGPPALQRALQEPNALPAASAKLVLQALNSIGRSDNTLSPLLMKLAGINTALPAYTKAYVTNIVKAAQSFGNAAEGKKIYEQTGCIACHTPGAAQSKIGPDLSAIARGLPIDMIVTEVVWPALNIKEGYEAVTVTLKDGSVVTGFKQTDTADTISIRDLTGAITPIPKANTSNIQLGGTVMPDGLTATLNEQQLAHLIKYLSELGK